LKKNINVKIIDLFSVHPIDKDGLISALKSSKNKLVVIEDHYERGGVGDRVVRALAGMPFKYLHRFVDHLPRSGKPNDLYKD